MFLYNLSRNAICHGARASCNFKIVTEIRKTKLDSTISSDICNLSRNDFSRCTGCYTGKILVCRAGDQRFSSFSPSPSIPSTFMFLLLSSLFWCAELLLVVTRCKTTSNTDCLNKVALVSRTLQKQARFFNFICIITHLCAHAHE